MDAIYTDGYEAFKHGIDVDECHYPSGRCAEMNDKRHKWLNGWYDAKYDKFWADWMDKKSLGDQAKLKAIFKKIEDEGLDNPPF